MLSAILIITLLSAIIGLLLSYTAKHFQTKSNPIVEQINQLLPQIQCGKCGYPGCRPYAEAIARNQDKINKCAPGQEATMLALAELLGLNPIPLNEQQDQKLKKVNCIAEITEEDCIGCTLCIQACPVDAILGSAKHMHTIIKHECTGCELCVPPCPVECIKIIPMYTDISNWSWPFPDSKESMIGTKYDKTT